MPCQVLMWNLQLDNIGVKPITSISATVEVKDTVDATQVIPAAVSTAPCFLP